jgi:hypothetical protein
LRERCTRSGGARELRLGPSQVAVRLALLDAALGEHDSARARLDAAAAALGPAPPAALAADLRRAETQLARAS